MIMIGYSDLYIEFDEENAAKGIHGRREWSTRGIDCVEGCYQRGRGKKSVEHFASYELHHDIVIEDIATEVTALLKERIFHAMGSGQILLVGLGNHHYTADALGRAVLDKVKIIPQLAKFYPQCKGETGIDSIELLAAARKIVKPDCIIIIDSLATNRLQRLGRVIQLTDGGITPGGGINNGGVELNRQLLSAPVLAIGVPLIIKSTSISASAGNNNPLLTSAAVDELIEDMSEIIATAINSAVKERG